MKHSVVVNPSEDTKRRHKNIPYLAFLVGGEAPADRLAWLKKHQFSGPGLDVKWTMNHDEFAFNTVRGITANGLVAMVRWSQSKVNTKQLEYWKFTSNIHLAKHYHDLHPIDVIVME